MDASTAALQPLTAKEKLKNFAINNGKTTACLIVWIAANVFVFFLTYARYRWSTANKATYALLGEGVTLARGAAATLNLNCALILFPVCRNILTVLRRTFVHHILPLDSNIVFHKLCAWAIAVAVAVHATAHYYNYETLGDVTEETSHRLAYGTVAGSTGHIITFSMVMLYTTALEKVRHQCFELFWYTHHLFVIFFGLLLIHGTPSSLQPNQFWGWFFFPGIAYMSERLRRVIRGNYDTTIAAIIQHPSKVIELQLRKPKMSIIAGQYLFINAPSIATYEWHPFTITSAPEEEIVSIHVRVVGDWTKALAARLGVAWGRDGEPIDAEINSAYDPYSLAFKIDGPFGSASEDYVHYDVAVMVGAGIGVTPFGSVLKSLWYRVAELSTMKLQRVYFIWTARDKAAFEWFAQIIAALENEELEHFLVVQIYLTAKLSLEEAREIAYADDASGRDAITGLSARTLFGRPNWNVVLNKVAEEHRTPGRVIDIGVFLCGPKVIGKQLRFYSNKISDVSPQTIAARGGIRMVAEAENF